MISRDVLVFAGQGSDGHFSDHDKVTRLKHHLGDARHVWNLFLTQCQTTFRELYDSLSADEKSIFPQDTLTRFSTAGAFLHPDPIFQTHPVFQTTTMFIRQMLELIIYHRKHGTSSVVMESSGVCTGVLSAILASSFTSYISNDFVCAAVDGFKICFFVGLRASLQCRQALGAEWNRHPCVLGVFKTTPRQVQDHLRTYNANVSVRLSTCTKKAHGRSLKSKSWKLNSMLSGIRSPTQSLRSIRSRLGLRDWAQREPGPVSVLPSCINQNIKLSLGPYQRVLPQRQQDATHCTASHGRLSQTRHQIS